jgi:hypothetical protein
MTEDEIAFAFDFHHIWSMNKYRGGSDAMKLPIIRVMTFLSG